MADIMLIGNFSVRDSGGSSHPLEDKKEQGCLDQEKSAARHLRLDREEKEGCHIRKNS